MKRVISILEQQKEGLEWAMDSLYGGEETKQTLIEVNKALDILRNHTSDNEEEYDCDILSLVKSLDEEDEFCPKYKWGDCECKGECKRGLRMK